MTTLAPDPTVAYPVLSTAELQHTPDNRFLLIVAGRVYQVGELLYHVIGRLQAGETLADICADYRLRGTQLREAEVDLVLRKYLAVPEELAPRRSSYLHTKFDLVGPELLHRLCQPLLGLFRGQLMPVLLVLAGLVTAAFVHRWGTFVLDTSSRAMLLSGVGAYVGLVLGIFCHELGHASAATRFGVAPKAIGFGFYLLFPVFFADVTNVWTLGKRPRIMINLAGVYLQLLFCVLLIGVFYLLPAGQETGRHLVGTIISMNVVVVLYSLNPFLRNDGYWVYSDLFDVPNLMSRSVLYPWRLLGLVAPENRAIPTTFRFPQDVALLVYSLANYGLFFYLLTLFYGYSSHTLLPRLGKLLGHADFPHNLLNWDDSLFLLKTFGLYGFMLYMTVFSFWRNLRNYRRRQARITALDQSAAADQAAATAPQATPLLAATA
jgi:putative peptide zinc metalloprotease protein